MVDIFLTTFQTLSNDLELIISFFKRQGIFPFFVVDEAHYIKQLNGVWANAVLEISRYCSVRCAITGTPIPNKYSDVFNLIDLLWGKNQILSSEDKIRIETAEKNKKAKYAQEIVRGAISPFFYRVRKTDLKLKSQIFLPPHIIRMNEVEGSIYKAIVTKIRSYTKQDYLSNIEIVHQLRRGRIMRLRQCVSYPKMMRSVIEGYSENLIDADSQVLDWIINYDKLEKPAKLGYLLNLIKEFRDKKLKVVIWSNFIESIELISNSLTQNGHPNKLIYGKTPTELTGISEEETRESIIREFVDPTRQLDILVANPAACAESISLHKTCETAIYYDLSYNCAQYLQSLDRIHRVGGSEDKEAFYNFLQYANSIDQDIKNNLEIKASRMSELIDEDFSIYSLNMFEDDDEDLNAYDRLFGTT